jgi:polyphenol oxidase
MKVVRQAAVFIAGILLILVGLVGLVMPIMPGWIFFFMGLSMIAPRVAARVRWWIFRKRFRKDVFIFDEWMPEVEAGYTTRHFSLHLSKSDDLLDREKQNIFVKLLSDARGTIDEQMKPMQKFVLLRQVHGDRIAVIEDAAAPARPGFYPQEEADGAISRIPGVTLLVFSADCLSIFFSAGEWVGLAHAGWRGTKEQIASKMLALISRRSGVPPKQVKIIFGPRIGKEVYEVGEDFIGHFPEETLHRKKGKLHFDLGFENRRQLLAAGADKRNIVDHGVCTVAQNRDLYSFRKEGERAGRLVSFLTRL